MDPKEILRFRNYLLTQNTIFDLELWVMTLIAMKLFLRHDELFNMKVEDFVEDITIVKDDGYVESLAVKVQVMDSYSNSNSAPCSLNVLNRGRRMPYLLLLFSGRIRTFESSVQLCIFLSTCI